MLFDAHGQKVAEAFAPVATQRSAEGHVEHEPEELIASLRTAIDAVCQRAAGSGHRVAAAGLATQRSSMACWNRRNGAALSPVISWQDRRNAEWLKQIEPRAKWIREHTGLVLTPHYGASKMRWCLDHLPEVRRAAEAGELAMGPLASFILFRLLRERPFVVDPANAARTQLWDPATREWSGPLLELFAVPRKALPKSVTSRYEYGNLDTPAGVVPLTVTTGDQSAVPFAFGPLDPAAAYINVGTGAFVQRAIRDRLPEAPRLLVSVVWSEAHSVVYMLEGTVNGAGSALDWFAARENADMNSLLPAVEASAASLNPPLFLNGVSGLGSPFWVSDFNSRFVGTGSLEERCLAVIESIVFLIRVNLDELRTHGSALRRLVLAGGLSSSELFCQRLADLTRIQVWRSRELEATARGLAWLVADHPGTWMPPVGDAFIPAARQDLDRRFAAWMAAMPL